MNHAPFTLLLKPRDPAQMFSGLAEFGIWFDRKRSGEYRRDWRRRYIAYSQGYPFTVIKKCEQLGIKIKVLQPF
jgi:hypothetical protein